MWKGRVLNIFWPVEISLKLVHWIVKRHFFLFFGFYLDFLSSLILALINALSVSIVLHTYRVFLLWINFFHLVPFLLILHVSQLILRDLFRYLQNIEKRKKEILYSKHNFCLLVKQDKIGVAETKAVNSRNKSDKTQLVSQTFSQF